MERSFSKRFRRLAARLVVAGAAVAVVASGASAQRAGRYTNPSLAGDYPDPSVVKVGSDYWATATSSEWGPEFPILHSRDLVNWDLRGYVFPERPKWAVGNFWAPEIQHWKGRYYMYYTARKEGGSLCVAVATATNPTGPWTDHGPLVCQEVGSIDGYAVDDENGRRYLLWKEDGNSRNLPTPLWAQQLSDDGTKLVGEMKEIMRNDAPWEAQLVEGPYVMRRNGWFYVFYSGNACCGRECNYALGVARSKTLLGPYEKNPANPILKGNDTWKCPGHGSIVSANGRDYLLYHAYSAKDFVYVGRQALLDAITWGADGWPTINEGRGPSVDAASPFRVVDRRTEYAFAQTFASARVGDGWLWPQGVRPVMRWERGTLVIAPPSGAQDAVLARSTTVGDYTATASLDPRNTGGIVGLSAYGDLENNLGVGLSGNKIVLWKRAKNQTETLASIDAPRGARLYLRMTATGGERFRFAVGTSPRGRFTDVGGEVSGDYLPPWDRGVRVALVATGEGAVGRFHSLQIVPRR